ncbi:hypothetical protein PMAYCL1PPCAC_02314 [Pristionchus mayeri]|uniref:Uncharacterized protein n=1 Tax=Pristionchus mayeri TaxID=1317129 RepID=A0AAN5C7U0_9BILA|nr:hypothetical protein PMAYCL1PPCAC_02314 [Pristionchus mayeri]
MHTLSTQLSLDDHSDLSVVFPDSRMFNSSHVILFLGCSNVANRNVPLHGVSPRFISPSSLLEHIVQNSDDCIQSKETISRLPFDISRDGKSSTDDSFLDGSLIRGFLRNSLLGHSIHDSSDDVHFVVFDLLQFVFSFRGEINARRGREEIPQHHSYSIPPPSLHSVN